MSSRCDDAMSNPELNRYLLSTAFGGSVFIELETCSLSSPYQKTALYWNFDQRNPWKVGEMICKVDQLCAISKQLVLSHAKANDHPRA